MARTFWENLDPNGEKAGITSIICRNRAQKDAMEILEEERNEISDLIVSLDRARIAYAYKDLFHLEARKRLIAAAIDENQREAERLTRLREKQ